MQKEIANPKNNSYKRKNDPQTAGQRRFDVYGARIKDPRFTPTWGPDGLRMVLGDSAEEPPKRSEHMNPFLAIKQRNYLPALLFPLSIDSLAEGAAAVPPFISVALLLAGLAALVLSIVGWFRVKRARTASAPTVEHHRDVMHNQQVGILVLSPVGRILEANPVFCRHVGVPEEQLRNRPLQQFMQSASFHQCLADIAETHMPKRALAQHFEMPGDANSSQGYFDWALAPVLDENQQLSKLVLFLCQTPGAQYAADAEQDQQASQQQIKQECYGVITDRISQPLTILLGNLMLVRHHLNEEDEEAQRIIQNALQATYRMCNIINDLRKESINSTTAATDSAMIDLNQPRNNNTNAWQVETWRLRN